MTTVATQTQLHPLIEHVQDWRGGEVRVDRARRLVRNVALTGLESKNGYRYSEQALRQALPLYEAKPVFLDHAAQSGRPFERSTRDLVGSVVRPRFENGRVRADIQALDTEAGRTFLALAESDSPAVGMSHVVLAERSGDGSLVEAIHDVVSVDAVVFPATPSTFRESSAEGETIDAEWPATPQAGDRMSLDSVMEQLRNELERVAAERDALRGRVEDLERERRAVETEREVDRLLTEARLPAFAVSEVFRQQLLAAPDHAARQTLIAERQGLLERLSRPTPGSRERLAQAATVSDATVIAAVRRGAPPAAARDSRRSTCD